VDNPRAEKVAVVEEVRQRFDDASAAILTEYRGLKVKDLAGLRRSVRASGGDYKIYKNTLVRLAAQGSGLTDLQQLLVGPTGIVFVDGDAASVARVLRDFSRTNPLLVIKGGVLGDRVMDARETTALADLPSREVLLARLAGALAAPMQQLAGLLQALPRNLAYGLAALRDQRAEGGVVDGAVAQAGEEASTGAAAPSAAAESAPPGEPAGPPEAAAPGEAAPTETAGSLPAGAADEAPSDASTESGVGAQKASASASASDHESDTAVGAQEASASASDSDSDSATPAPES
jgi:large subunit ribosomal protein L10